MRVGIGLPAAVPEADMTTLGRWSAAAGRAGFSSAGVIDRDVVLFPYAGVLDQVNLLAEAVHAAEPAYLLAGRTEEGS